MELINEFLNSDNYMELYKTPFNFKDYTIATDGYTIIFIHRDEKYKETKQIERFEKTLNDILNDIETSNFKLLLKINIPEFIICSNCNGSKKSDFQICPECDGEGTVDAGTDYNTYYDLECKTCNGDGEIIIQKTDENCKKCNSTGKIEQEDFPIPIEDIHIKFKYIKRIMNIDNIEISANKKKSMFLFKTKDLKGAIMGLKM